MLGFIFRCGKYFTRQSSLLMLYNTLVRSRLEYCSTAWNPIYNNSIDQIERVQKKFSRMYYFKFNLGNPRPQYDIRLKHLNMHSLESRRLENDEIMLFKTIHGQIDSDQLRESLSVHQPARFTRTSQNRTFYLPKMASNYEMNAPLNRIQMNHDVYFATWDVFHGRLPKFKKTVRNHFEY